MLTSIPALSYAACVADDTLIIMPVRVVENRWVAWLAVSIWSRFEKGRLISKLLSTFIIKLVKKTPLEMKRSRNIITYLAGC